VLSLDFSKPCLEFGTPGGRDRSLFCGSELERKRQTGNSHGSGSKKGTEEIPALYRILEVGHGSPPLVMGFNCERTVAGKVQNILCGVNHIIMWWLKKGFL
jgi:hypothetical protein